LRFWPLIPENAPCPLHLKRAALILSGLGVQGVKSLAFWKIFFGTAKPDIPEKTRQAARPKNLHKPLIFSLIHPLSGYFSIPDNITEASHP
jgi:hypothetical protein